MIDRDVLAAYVKKHYTYCPDSGRVHRIDRDRDVKGSRAGKGYMKIEVCINRVVIAIGYHRVVWLLCHGRWPTQIDHIDGNRRNNRVENLREVSGSENLANRVFPWRPHAVTGLPGVRTLNGVYSVDINYTRYYFGNKHQAFITTILLGKMYENK